MLCLYGVLWASILVPEGVMGVTLKLKFLEEFVFCQFLETVLPVTGGEVHVLGLFLRLWLHPSMTSRKLPCYKETNPPCVQLFPFLFSGCVSGKSGNALGHGRCISL